MQRALQYMVSPQGRNTWTVDDLVPYVEKLTILSEEQERIIEPVSHGPFTQYPAQMYHYRSKGHQSDTSASEHSLGGVTKTYPNFSWPTMTLHNNMMLQVLRLTKLKSGDIMVEEILINKHEYGNTHAAHPHIITDIMTIDFHITN